LSAKEKNYFYEKLGVEFGFSGTEIELIQDGKAYLIKKDKLKTNIPVITENALVTFTKDLDLNEELKASIVANTDMSGNIDKTLELVHKNFKLTQNEQKKVDWNANLNFNLDRAFDDEKSGIHDDETKGKGIKNITVTSKGQNSDLESIKAELNNPNWSFSVELEKAINRNKTGNAADADTIRVKNMVLNNPRMWQWYGGYAGVEEVFGDTMSKKEKSDLLKLAGSMNFDKGFSVSSNFDYRIDDGQTTGNIKFSKEPATSIEDLKSGNYSNWSGSLNIGKEKDGYIGNLVFQGPDKEIKGGATKYDLGFGTNKNLELGLSKMFNKDGFHYGTTLSEDQIKFTIAKQLGVLPNQISKSVFARMQADMEKQRNKVLRTTEEPQLITDNPKEVWPYLDRQFNTERNVKAKGGIAGQLHLNPKTQEV
jgi:hypothetical protein